METYRIIAPYWINGHKNVDGMALADAINRSLNDADRTTDLRSYQTEMDCLGDLVKLYELSIETAAVDLC